MSRKNDSNISTWALPKGAISRLGRGWVQDITFSPEGTYLVVGTRLGVWWYELSTLSPIALWETERGLVSAVAFSPCGRWLATGSWDGIVKVWDVKDGVCVAQLEQRRKRLKISQIVFSPDGQQLAASCQREAIVSVWHQKTGEEIARFEGHTTYRNCRPAIPLTFSPDGCLLTCASPNDTSQAADFISVWNVSTGECIAHLRGHTTQVYALSFSPCGGFLASGDRSGTLRVWDVAAAKTVAVSSEYAEKYRVIPSYSPSGTLFASGVGGSTITVWDTERGEKVAAFEHRDTISALRFSNGTHLAVAGPFDFKVWTAETSHQVSSISGHTHIPFSLTFSLDGETLASVGGGLATCWNVATKQPRWIRRANTRIRSVSISQDRSMRALGNKGNTFNVWNVETNETIATLTAHDKSVNEVVFSPKGGLWASGDIAGKVYVWDSQGKQTACSGHTGSIESLALSPDEKCLASASRDKTARVWDVASGDLIVSLVLTPLLDTNLYRGDASEIQKRRNSLAKAVTEPRPIQIENITFSPCGNIIAGGLLREIRLWDARTYDVRMSILPPPGCYYPFALTFSPCGRYLASGSWWQGTDKVSIRLWEVTTGENIATLWSHPTDVQDLAFSPDGTLLASGSFDSTILLWDMKPYLHHEIS